MIYIVYKEVFHFSTLFSTNGGKVKKPVSVMKYRLLTISNSSRRMKFLLYSISISNCLPVMRQLVLFLSMREALPFNISERGGTIALRQTDGMPASLTGCKNLNNCFLCFLIKEMNLAKIHSQLNILMWSCFNTGCNLCLQTLFSKTSM